MIPKTKEVSNTKKSFLRSAVQKSNKLKRKTQQQQKTNLVKTILVQQYKYNSHAKYFTNQNQSI